MEVTISLQVCSRTSWNSHCRGRHWLLSSGVMMKQWWWCPQWFPWQIFSWWPHLLFQNLTNYGSIFLGEVSLANTCKVLWCCIQMKFCFSSFIFSNVFHNSEFNIIPLMQGLLIIISVVMNISIISSICIICISIMLMMTGINISIIISIIMTGINSDPRRQGNRTQPCSSNKKSFKASLIIIINIMMIINEITILMNGQVHGRSLCGEVYEEAHLAETHSSVKQVSIIDIIINMVNIFIKNIIISLFSAPLYITIWQVNWT